MNNDVSPAVRAHLAALVAARDVADHSYAIVGDAATPMLPGERIRRWRQIRMDALTGLDRTVLAELLEGTSWEDVADALGLTVEETRARYEKTLELWRSGRRLVDRTNYALFGEHSVGLREDTDPRGTAETLDAWYRRHAEPWAEPDARPVSRLFDDE